MKIAFVFPGQGAQYVGMGKEIVDNFKNAREIFELADEALGYKLSELCFEGPEEKLQKTYYTQPAVLTTSVALLQVLLEKGIQADFVAGHSLGEYSAVVASQALTFADAVQLVSKRGKFMEEAVPNGQGSMAAILGLDFEAVEELCKEASSFGTVEPANLNCPGQVVIAGETKAVEKAIEIAPTKGARRAIPLKVSGPFHSSLMTDASEKLALELDSLTFKDPEIPLVNNYSGDVITSSKDLVEGLKKQVNSPVLWDKSVRTLLDKGVDTFIEIGPGKVLSGLIKKINKNVNIYNVENLKTLHKTLEKLEEQENVS